MYNPDKAAAVTKPKTPAAKIGTSERIKTFALPSSSEKNFGIYDSKTTFGSNVKNLTIGVKRIEKIEMKVGPGEYDPAKAEEFTRSRSPTTKISKAASRPKSFALPN